MGPRSPRGTMLAEALLGLVLAAASLVFALRPAALAEEIAGAPVASSDPSEAPTVAYALEVRLDTEAHALDGTGSIRWYNRSRLPQRELWVHLYLNAFRAGSQWTRDRIGGFRGGGAPSPPGHIEVTRFEIAGMGELWPDPAHTPGDPDDETDIRVSLPREVAPGEAIDIDIAFRASLPNVVMRTGFSGSFHMVAQWFPKLARLEPDGTWRHFPFHRLSEFYADFGSYDVTIDVPEDFLLGATGVTEDLVVEEGRKRQRQRAERVHDFAFTAWDGFSVVEREGPEGVRLRCLHPAERPEVCAIELDEVEAALPILAEAYGPYPYPLLTIVHPPASASEAGGMEYPMLITTGGDDIMGVRALAAVTVHELAHQWFYGLLASDEHRFPFLDEGLTTYATTRALEVRYPGASLLGTRYLTLGHAELSRAMAAESADADPIAQPASAFVSGRDYGVLVYQRTATLLETLRRVYGDDAMTRALGGYARQHRFAHPSPDDLLEAIGRELGAHAREQLRRGLFERGTVDYAIVSADSRPSGDLYETRLVVRRGGTLELPVTVELKTRDGRVTYHSWDGRGATTVISETTAAPFESASVDPEGHILIDHDLGNNHRRKSPAIVAPRVLAIGGAFTALLLGLGAP